MVGINIISQPVYDGISLVDACKPTPTSDDSLFTGIPVIDLFNPDAKTLIVKACQDFGFFKVINHGVPMEFITRLEAETVKFFNLPQSEKDKAGPPNPFGYGNRRIGSNGDMGWIEYLLFSTDPELVSQFLLSDFPRSPQNFWKRVNEYVSAVRKIGCDVLELIADGLGIEPRDTLSRLLKDEKSDSCFRLNHYPPSPEMQALSMSGLNLVGFGEHTDPQIISILRSNNTSGLQISVKDGTWLSVPPDYHSFFVNVGDSLQVMTNGRFKSLKHRVLATENVKSRVSMIFFGGPALNENIAPIETLMKEGEVSLYKEFTWGEYKKSAYKTRLSENRLQNFVKSEDN